MKKATPKESATTFKKRTTSHSDLVDKYGKDQVSRARDMVRAETGKKILRTPAEWAAVGQIVKEAKKHGKKLTLYKVDRVAKRTKAKGVEKGFYAKLVKKK